MAWLRLSAMPGRRLNQRWVAYGKGFQALGQGLHSGSPMPGRVLTGGRYGALFSSALKRPGSMPFLSFPRSRGGYLDSGLPLTGELSGQMLAAQDKGCLVAWAKLALALPVGSPNSGHALIGEPSGVLLAEQARGY